MSLEALVKNKVSKYNSSSSSDELFIHLPPKKVILIGQNLEKVDYSNLDLTGSNFTDSNLTKANFTGSNLKKTNFTRANLEEANFKNANLKGVNLEGAFLGSFGYYFGFEEAKNYQSSAQQLEPKIIPHLRKNEPKEYDQSILDCSLENKSDILKYSKTSNPINSNKTCTLLNNKKNKYYIHTYDPSSIRRKMEKTGLFPNMAEVFDFTIREKCCNCISISLYYTNEINLEKCELFLASIRRTIDNVKKNLPDWIVRVYLDSSVYKSLIAYQKQNKNKGLFVKESLNYLLDADNVEIYTYCCKDVLTKKVLISRSRAYRFLPLSDTDVNVRIIREADGIVTNVDCHNIKAFTKSKYIFYLPEYIKQYNYTNNDTFTGEYGGYSLWLRMYTQCLQSEYFDKKHQLYDLLAGTLGVRLMVKRSYFDNKVKEVKKLIKYADYDCIKEIGVKNPENSLNIGFDEILLLHIYRDYISCPIEAFDTDEDIPLDVVEYKSQILSFICATHNMTVFDIGKINTYKFSTLILAISSMINQGLIKRINVMKLITKLNTLNIVLTSKVKSSEYDSLAVIFALFDSLMTEENVITDVFFDVKFTDESYNKKTLLSNINIGYGTSTPTMDETNIDQLPYLDYIYDFL